MNPDELQELLDTGVCSSAQADGLARRISSVRSYLLERRGPRAAAPDLVVLVRQAMERWALAERGGNRSGVRVRVPSATPWPSREDWERASLACDTVGEGQYLVYSHPWQPSWLSPDDWPVVEAAIAMPSRRPAPDITADALAARALGQQFAASLGQRDAIRSVYLTPAGANVLVVLPTGAGKSSAFQFAALHSGSTGGMVVVVVPTVALARDQEARYRALATKANQSLPTGVPLAFHSGLSTDQRALIFRCIEDGELPILFTAPEALFGSLQSPLLIAAEKGFISLFAVDEAHMIAQWAEFRPQFQAMSGLRDALRSRCPPNHSFRTLLLTATLTAEGFDVLTTVFGKLNVVAQVSLRPEPSYLISSCETDAEKSRRIEEAIYHLPRPLIVYTTLRDDTDVWHERLRALGFERIRHIRGGDMSGEQGADVLRGWNTGDIDVIVATSAFGLGVDQSEVRSVVHACLPESLDRWYQEVGRAGRAGRACVALLVADEEDRQTAKRMGAETLIGFEKAWERWTAMRTDPHKVRYAGQLPNAPEREVLGVRLAALPPGFDVSTDRNRLWNLRTLAMMVQAKLLRFSHAVVEAPDRGSLEAAVDGDDASASPEDRTSYAHVSILNTDHLDKVLFAKHFDAARRARREGDEEDIRRLEALSSGSRSVHELLRETYTIASKGISPPRTQGNCPTSRRLGRANNLTIEPRLIRPSEAPDPEVREPLNTLFHELPTGYHGPLLVRYDAATGGWAFLQQRLKESAARLATLGVVEFAWPNDSTFGALDWARLASLAPCHYVFAADSDDDPVVAAWQVPRVTLLATPDIRSLRAALRIERPRHIVFVPSGTSDPHHAHRAFDVSRTHMELSTFSYRLRPR